MSKRDIRLLMSQKSNLGKIPLKPQPISTEHGERDVTVVKMVEDDDAVLITNICKQLLSRILINV